MIDYDRIPPRTRDSLDAYVKHRQPTGGFLYAVLTNDLRGACGRADAENGAALRDIVAFCCNKMPAGCCGSPDIVAAWLAGAHAETRP